MSGIAGFWKINSGGPERALKGRFLRMAGMSCSGEFATTAGNCWEDTKQGIIFGYERGSFGGIPGFTPGPVESLRGRYVIALDGEIYNAGEINEELGGEKQRAGMTGHDNNAGIVMDAISEWGMERALKEFDGAFNLVLWDKEDKKLFFARDRIGAKSFYYGIQNGVLFFASGLRAICAHDAFVPDIDRNSLALFFRYGYVPTPHAIYKNIVKLEQASYAVTGKDGSVRTNSYWNAMETFQDTRKEPLSSCFEKKKCRELEDLITKAIDVRMTGNTETGIFLSGGIDSSLIAVLAQKARGTAVRTFSLGMHEKEYDESEDARRISDCIGSKHMEHRVTSKDVLRVISKMPDIYDEPFADSSQVPVFMISQFVKGHVDASLSGDGGDELFGGYNRYLWSEKIWNLTKRLPSPVKRWCASRMRSVSATGLDRMSGGNSFFTAGRVPGFRLPGNKLHKLSDILASASKDELYLTLVSHWKKPSELVIGSSEPATLLSDSGLADKIPCFIDRMMFLDMVTYLPDDGMIKVTKASEAAGLKTRAPILARDVVGFSREIPLSMKIRNGKGKWILRRILSKYIDEKLFDRPKMGFGVPIGDWLRGDLRDWAEDLLDRKKIKDEAILDPDLVRRIWREHLYGKKDNHYPLWDVLMFQSWKRSWSCEK
ncbi:MAG: asparagine synthase (glutamine-hydrolyzing) [Candidatus Omnitrophota bacterium]